MPKKRTKHVVLFALKQMIFETLVVEFIENSSNKSTAHVRVKVEPQSV